MGRDGGKQCLPCTFTHSRPRVNAQLAQLGIQAQPQAVERGSRVEGPVQGLSFLLGLFLQRFFFSFQLLRDCFSSLEEIV